VSSMRPSQGLSAKQKALATAMLTYWATFAKTGDPNPSAGTKPPVWPLYKATSARMLSLVGAVPKIMTAASFDAAHKCSSLWNGLSP
jgi:carboxylesterase type B